MKICPLLSIGVKETGCMGKECAWWDGESCVENPMPILQKAIESIALDIYKPQLKAYIKILLEEKTGWGRVELKRRLFELIDKTGSERIEIYNIHSEKDEDLPF